MIVIQSGFQGHAVYNFQLSIIDDFENEEDEVLHLYFFTNDGAVFGFPFAIVMIEDDDPRKYQHILLISTAYD